MNKAPLFSIITVCYNSETTILQTMESVAKQSFSDYEYIIIDGRSTDSTCNIIKNNLSLFDNEVLYISEADTGIYDAMNKGIKLSHGMFLCFLNSDDWFEPDALEIINNVYRSKDLKLSDGASNIVLYGGQRTITNGMEENCVFYNHQFLPQNMICHQACFVSRKCFDNYGLFNIGYKSAADYELTLKMYLSGEVTFIPVYEILVNFSSGGMSESYTGRLESNKIRYDLGIISRKAFLIEKLKCLLSKVTYAFLRSKPKKVWM